MTFDENFHELLKGEFDLDIPNFEKWNPPILNRQTRVPSGNQRRDWINLSVDFWLDPRLHDAPPTLVLFYVKLLCVRGASGGALSKITLRYVRTRIGTRAYSVERELVKLLKLGLIRIAKKKEKKVSKGEMKDTKTKLTNSPFSFLKKETVKILKKHNVTKHTAREWIEEHGAEKLDRLMPRAEQTFIESKIGNPEKWGNSKFSNYFDGFVKNHRKGKDEPPVQAPEKILKDAGRLLQGGPKT